MGPLSKSRDINLITVYNMIISTPIIVLHSDYKTATCKCKAHQMAQPAMMTWIILYKASFLQLHPNKNLILIFYHFECIFLFLLVTFSWKYFKRNTFLNILILYFHIYLDVVLPYCNTSRMYKAFYCVYHMVVLILRHFLWPYTPYTH